MALQTSAVDVDRYRRDGFLTAPSVLTADQLSELRAESDRVMALCAQDPMRHASRIEWEVDHLAEPDRVGMDKVIRKLEPVSDLSPLFAECAFYDGVAGPISAIIGDAVELFEDKLNLKLPAGSSYPWHQDWSCCWRAHTDELITCFIYLDDANDINGCLQVIPGSHLGKPTYPFAGGQHFEVDPAVIAAAPPPQPAPLRAGDMIYFDPYLLHYSAINRSHQPRRALIYTYNPARLGKINEDRFPRS
jgi:ectoine hydroxylase-related dioxygenase (phytanoyl-CoA dioxygenase family)